MPERIFCVDFGSAFTKVALRTAAQEDGKLIPCSDEGLELWAPTVVAADWTRSSTEPRLEFGYRAAAIKPGGKIVVYSNFKKDLFTDTAAADGRRDAPARRAADVGRVHVACGQVQRAVRVGTRSADNGRAAKAMFGADSRASR